MLSPIYYSPMIPNKIGNQISYDILTAINILYNLSVDDRNSWKVASINL